MSLHRANFTLLQMKHFFAKSREKNYFVKVQQLIKNMLHKLKGIFPVNCGRMSIIKKLMTHLLTSFLDPRAYLVHFL